MLKRPSTSLWTGFTLLELMIVVVVVGLLASIAYPNYATLREKTLDKEAISALVLIRNSERMFFSHLEAFYPTPTGTQANINHINGNLSLDLSANNWAFSVTTTSATAFTARAVRGGRTWSVTNAAGQPGCAGACL